MSFKIQAAPLLDRETCYNMWVKERLSIYKIPKILASRHGIVHPKTGKPVTSQGVWRAANLHMLDNPEMAKNDTVSLFAQYGKVLNQDEWGVEMINRAQRFLSKKVYSAWLLKNKEYYKYVPRKTEQGQRATKYTPKSAIKDF